MFGGFWNLAFILAISHFVVTAGTCIWYFNRQVNDKTHPFLTGLWWLFRYHLGSVAFGSLILALVYVLRVIADMIHVS